jgi:hypothetical protein
MPGQSTKDDPAYNAGGMDGEDAGYYPAKQTKRNMLAEIAARSEQLRTSSALTRGEGDVLNNPPCIGGCKRKKEPPISAVRMAVFCVDRGEKNGKMQKNAFFLRHCLDLAV